MTYTLLGFKHISFKGKENEDVTGYTLYLGSDFPHGEGLQVEKFFFSDYKCDRCQFVPVLGNEYTVYFNRMGKLDFIEDGIS